MAYEQLINAINANIRRNGVQAITGNLLNGILNAMVTNLTKGYQFGGVISPDSEFTPDDRKHFFIAKTAGTYEDFGGFVLPADQIGIITYDNGVWDTTTIPMGSGSVDAYTKAESDAKFATKGAVQELSGNVGSISTNLTSEIQRATSAESALSQRIDTIVQGRNVRDIVGNYAELEAYDTSTLGDNDIVMVLLDNTKSGHTTYYRWKQTEGEWEFIGGLAFTYTKTEIDEKFSALHIVLPTIPADAEAHPENYQELLAQVDTMVRGAGADASFKMPIADVGNVDVTLVKTNPANVYLGVFADDRSYLYHIARTISTPRTYTYGCVEKVFATTADLAQRVKVVDINDEIWRGMGAQDMTLIDGTPILVMENGRCFATIFPSTDNQYDWLWQDLNEGWGLTSVPGDYDMQNTWGELFGYLEDNVSYLASSRDIDSVIRLLGNKADADNVVYLTGDQEISGAKTFNSPLRANFAQLVDTRGLGSLNVQLSQKASASQLTTLQTKVGEKAKVTPTLTIGTQIATITTENAEGQAVETPLYAPQGGGSSDLPLSVVDGKLCITFNE